MNPPNTTPIHIGGGEVTLIPKCGPTESRRTDTHWAHPIIPRPLKGTYCNTCWKWVPGGAPKICQCKKPMKTERTIFDTDKFDSPEIPANLADFVEFFDNLLNQVPKDSYNTARVTFRMEDHYAGGKHVQCKVWYVGPETPKEKIARLHQESIRKQQGEENQRKLYAELKAKFGE